jgi:ABC-2 type transport system permease protein
MSESLSHKQAPVLLHYRPWRGQLGSPNATVWPIARTALGMMFRRKLFWALYALALLFFLFFFFGQYIMVLLETQSGTTAGGPNNPGDWMVLVRTLLRLDGTGETYHLFFGYQGHMVMNILALAGSVLIGNDLRFGSLPFYLSKPVSRYHYLGGKALAVAVFVNLITTLPAGVLWIEYGLLQSKQNYFLNGESWLLLLGIFAYGAVLTVTLTMILLATAVWVKRTVPMIMIWTTLFFFLRLFAGALVYQLRLDPHWQLIDLWHDTRVLGNVCLGNKPLDENLEPAWYWAALVLGGVILTCLTYLILSFRAVEVVK